MMRESLFYTFLAIFAATAWVTLLGVTQRIRIERRYLNVLFTALLIELAGAVIGLFKTTDFFPTAAAGEVVNEPTLRDRLVGTRWMYSDSGGTPPSPWVLLRDGKLAIFFPTAPLAEFNSWEVTGPSNIVFRVGSSAAISEGIVTAASMSGTGSNRSGGTWTWKAELMR
jgi:hypothetical protein